MVTSWQSSLQLKVEQIRNIVSEDKVNIDDYVQSAPIDSKIMFETIKSYINNMKNEDIKNIVNLMVEKNKEKLMYYPAAKKNHHSIKSGLLYHITTMLNLGE